MSKQLEETLKQLQEGAADNNATVMLEGERFRVRTEDGYSALYELDQNGGAFKCIERMNADGTAEEIKQGGESCSLESAVKEMEEGPKRRKAEADKLRTEQEQKAETDAKARGHVPPEKVGPSGNPNAPGNPTGSATHVNSGNPQQVPNQQGRPQAQPTVESISPKEQRHR